MLIILSLRQTVPGSLRTYPTLYLPVFTGVLEIRDLVVFVIAFNNVLKDGPAFKDTDLLSVVPCIRQGRDPAIGVDFQKPRLFLLVLS